MLTRAFRELVHNEPEDEPEGEYTPKRTTLLPVKSPIERHDRTALAELKKIIRSLTYGEMMEACGAMTDQPDYKATSNRDELAAMLHKYARKAALSELRKIIPSLTYGEMMEACGAMTDQPDYKAPSNRDELAAMLHKYACEGRLS
jgi:hypothetical protein